MKERGGWECKDCDKSFKHLRPHLEYETLKGRRVRVMVIGDTAVNHEASTGHRVRKVIGPRI